MGHPGYLPLTLYRGDSYWWRLVVHADVTGASGAGAVRVGGVVVPLVATVIDPGTIDVELAAEAWGDAKRGRGDWDVQLTWPDGRVYTVLAGPVVVGGDVTA